MVSGLIGPVHSAPNSSSDGVKCTYSFVTQHEHSTLDANAWEGI
jgi:hypothetical protein